VERSCKNCGDLVYATKTHCSNCGAKWIQNRITMRQVGMDFSDMYLGVDTKFVHTFVDLFRKPEAVITGYINGRRMYYMDAIRYLLLALFITGIYMFIVRSSGTLDNYMVEVQRELGQVGGDAAENAKVAATQKKVTDFIFDFLSLITLLTIPLLALIGRITFWGKRYFNFTEQIVFYLYTFAHITIATTPITIILLWISPEVFTYWTFLTYPFMFLYNAYCYKRCFNLDLSTTILRSLVSLIIMVIVFLGTMILVFLLSFLAALIADKLGYDVKGFFETNFA
jgi:hypothetical protein